MKMILMISARLGSKRLPKKYLPHMGQPTISLQKDSSMPTIVITSS